MTKTATNLFNIECNGDFYDRYKLHCFVYEIMAAGVDDFQRDFIFGVTKNYHGKPQISILTDREDISFPKNRQGIKINKTKIRLTGYDIVYFSCLFAIRDDTIKNQVNYIHPKDMIEDKFLRKLSFRGNAAVVKPGIKIGNAERFIGKGGAVFAYRISGVLKVVNDDLFAKVITSPIGSLAYIGMGMLEMSWTPVNVENPFGWKLN